MTTPTQGSWTAPVLKPTDSPITGYQMGARQVTDTTGKPIAGSVAGTYTSFSTVGPTIDDDALSTLAPTPTAGGWAAAVRGLTAAGNTIWSNESTFTVPVTIPGPPTGFIVA